MGRLRVLVLVLLALALPALGQQALPDAPSASNWHNVEQLASGRTVQVRAKDRHQTCVIQRVSTDSVTCAGGADRTYARAEIRTVRVHHRWRSALVGAAVGFGAGAIVGAATAGPGCKPNTFCLDILSRGDVAAIGGIVFGVVGVPVGYGTDFMRSTVYKSR